MTALYTYTEQFAKLKQYATDGTSDPEVLRDTMDSIKGPFEDKAVDYVKVIRDLESDAKEARNEAARISKRASSLEKNAKFMRNVLAQSMSEIGTSSIKTPLFTIYTTTQQKLSVPTDPNKLPPEFIKTTESIDRAGLTKALKSGRQIPNAVLVPNVSLGVR